MTGCLWIDQRAFMSGKRISLELPEELVEQIDCLRKVEDSIQR